MNIRMIAAVLGFAGLAACTQPARQAVYVPEAAPAKRIVREGVNFKLPDGTLVSPDDRGGFSLPNGDYVRRDARGGLLLPTGARCVPDAAGYICP